MTLFESFIFFDQGRPFSLRSPVSHLFGALAVCSLVTVGAYQMYDRSQSKVLQLQAELIASTQQSALPRVRSLTAQVPALRPATWPLRQTVDEVVQQTSQEALRAGVAVRSLSVSHHAPSPVSWGRVNLEVSAAGSYAALKAWQADVSRRFPALAVQHLRMQAAAAGAAALESQWTWVIYVRD